MLQPAPTILIFMGKNGSIRLKEFKPYFPNAMALPDRSNPASIHWPVQGKEVYLIDTSAARPYFINHFVKVLFSYGATKITYISSKSNQVFKRSLKNV